MFDDKSCDLGVSQQRQELGTLIVDPRATFLNDLGDGSALGVAPTDQSLGLHVEVLFILTARHTRVDGDVWLFR